MPETPIVSYCTENTQFRATISINLSGSAPARLQALAFLYPCYWILVVKSKSHVVEAWVSPIEDQLSVVVGEPVPKV